MKSPLAGLIIWRMEKIVRRRTEAMDPQFKRDLLKLVDDSGYSFKTFADLLGVSTSQLGAWVNENDDAMPSGPAYRLIRMAHEMPTSTFGFLAIMYEKKKGKPVPRRSAAGRPKTRGRPSEDRPKKSVATSQTLMRSLDILMGKEAAQP